MGRFASLVVLLLAACGDNSVLDGQPGPGPNDQVGANNTDGASPRYVPSVCGAQTWTTSVSNVAMDVAVAGRPDGATILATPQAGGDLTGFVLDTRMRMVADATKVAIDTPFEQIAVSYVGDRIVSTGIASGALYLHLLDNDLTNPQLVTKIPANTLPQPAFYNTQADIVMPVGDDNGLTLYRFADSLEPIDTLTVAPTKPVRSMAATQLGVSTLAAWSTDTECYMMQLAGYAPGPMAYQPVACPSPSIAVNQKTGAGVMVFDSAEGVRVMFTQATQMGGDARVLRPDTSSAHTLFDGTNFWVTFLDSRGDLIVGFLDSDRQLVSMSLGGPHPLGQAYDLAMVEGAPWVFALDENGYSGHRLCVDAQW